MGSCRASGTGRRSRCLRCLLLVMCTYPFAKKVLTLHLERGEGRERYIGCNLMQRKVLASSHQHLMAEAPSREQSRCACTQLKLSRFVLIVSSYIASFAFKYSIPLSPLMLLHEPHSS